MKREDRSRFTMPSGTHVQRGTHAHSRYSPPMSASALSCCCYGPLVHADAAFTLKRAHCTALSNVLLLFLSGASKLTHVSRKRETANEGRAKNETKTKKEEREREPYQPKEADMKRKSKRKRLPRFQRNAKGCKTQNKKRRKRKSVSNVCEEGGKANHALTGR